MNGNRLRTAHRIVDRYARFYDAVFAKRFLPRHRGRSTCFRRTASRCDRPPTTTPRAKRRTPEFLTRLGQRRRNPKAMVTRILVNWAKAIAAYEYRLNSLDSAFDRFVAEGPGSGRSPAAAKRGARLFVGKAACVDCHLGPQLTDDQFHNIGVPQARRHRADCSTDCPTGNARLDCSATATRVALRALGRVRRAAGACRHDVRSRRRIAGCAPATGAASRRTTRATRYFQRPLTDDLKGAWRTPSLRNVALTAPYMHDGALRDAGGCHLALQHRRSDAPAASW